MTNKSTKTKPEEMTIKVILSVADRLNLYSIMPPRGSLSEMALSESLVKRVNITKDEEKEFEMITLDNGRRAWKKEKSKLREFRFEDFEILLIQQGIRMHDDAKTLLPINHDLARRLLNITVNERKEVKK